MWSALASIGTAIVAIGKGIAALWRFFLLVQAEKDEVRDVEQIEARQRDRRTLRADIDSGL